MPIYNFLCTNRKCKYEFDEVYLSWSEDVSKQKCPKCGKKAKKIPSTNARMKQNWSHWNALG